MQPQLLFCFSLGNPSHCGRHHNIPLAHGLREARPEAARVHQRRLPRVGVVEEVDVGPFCDGLGCYSVVLLNFIGVNFVTIFQSA